MNLIRYFTEHKYFVGKTVPLIEKCLSPLLRYCADPQAIDFDDDLIFCIEALIKKAQGCSPVIQEIFLYLKNFQQKYNGMLANLTTCLNSYIIFGREFIEQSEQHVQALLEMAWKAISLNPEGAHNIDE